MWATKKLTKMLVALIRELMRQSIQEWTKQNSWKTAFKKLHQIDHLPSNFLKVVFQKFYLIHSWILCLKFPLPILNALVVLFSVVLIWEIDLVLLLIGPSLCYFLTAPAPTGFSRPWSSAFSPISRHFFTAPSKITFLLNFFMIPTLTLLALTLFSDL